MTSDGILFINGSPRRGRSTSASIIGHMRNLIGDSLRTDVVFATGCDLSDRDLVDSMIGSRIIILVSPLYVDALPSEVLELMRTLGENDLKGISFMAVFNCGFPESSHNSTAISICRNYSAANGMRWLGGLAIGGGGAIDGRPLSANGPERHVMRSLQMVCDSLVEDAPIPEEAFSLASRQFFPVWLYMIVANHQWKTRAKGLGVKKSLKYRPYQ